MKRLVAGGWKTRTIKSPLTSEQILDFLVRLEGPEGCNFRRQGEAQIPVWCCKGGTDQSFARAILANMGVRSPQIDSFLKFCTSYGGHCDCEIIFNASQALTQLASKLKRQKASPLIKSGRQQVLGKEYESRLHVQPRCVRCGEPIDVWAQWVCDDCCPLHIHVFFNAVSGPAKAAPHG